MAMPKLQDAGLVEMPRKKTAWGWNGQVSAIERSRRRVLVESGKASYWMPLRGVEDAADKAGLP